MKQKFARFAPCLAVVPGLLSLIFAAPAGASEFPQFHISGKSVAATKEGKSVQVAPGERLGDWTLMAVVDSRTFRHSVAVFEDFTTSTGSLLFADGGNLKVELTKSLEPTWAEPKTLYHGHTLKAILESDRDLLAGELLTSGGDPRYEEVASCFPPIAKMHVYTFVGTPECFEKVGIFYGGSTPNFDPAAYVPAIARIREQGRVLDGLIGGWLPAVRFVYPEEPGNWTELVVYAPFRVENDNQRVQPVWYRIVRVEGNRLRWARYFDSYHPFPPHTEGSVERFYTELFEMRSTWNRALERAMQIRIPDQRLADLARHSLVREMITRVGVFPKYGVFDRSYGGSEHDGFPDTFTADTTTMLEWGLFDRAGQYIDNYFRYFVRDDGSILYRGPETGQFGRMLTLVAEYANDTGDTKLLRRHQRRIDAITRLLLDMRAKALRLGAADPAYGMLAGWSEADACLDPDPPRYMQPYFSNSAEAARGFDTLGAVWEKAGRVQNRGELASWGRQLRAESRSLQADLQTAMARSVLTNAQPPCLPAIAGAKEAFDVACRRDRLDPQFRSYRAYMEMLYSGLLTREQVATVANYRAAHRDTILGIPTAYGYNTHELAGFLSYGHAYGLLQHDFIREYLLCLYSLMAHQYTRGTWTAPETRLLDPGKFAAPYCAPAQMDVPLLLRWMLVFEDPATNELWLAKATPRGWLADGQTVSVADAPTRWGRVSFEIRSHLETGRIDAVIKLPAQARETAVRVRLRVPEGHRMRAVTVNGRSWGQFDPDLEVVTLRGDRRGRVEMEVEY